MPNSTPLPGRKVRGSDTGRPMMAAFDLLSRRWMLRVVWELRNGPLKFRALRTACADLSPTLLNTRLKELREARLVRLSIDGYQLTELGYGVFRALEPISVWAYGWAREIGNATDDP